MAYFTTVKLLTYDPTSALLIAVNDQTGLSLHPSYVEVGPILSANGNLATVKITARNIAPNLEEKRFLNGGPVEFTRLDLSSFFGGSFKIPYDGAISSLDVARIITDRTGIIFDDRDFQEAVITASANKLKASPNSLRWIGELTIIAG